MDNGDDSDKTVDNGDDPDKTVDNGDDTDKTVDNGDDADNTVDNGDDSDKTVDNGHNEREHPGAKTRWARGWVKCRDGCYLNNRRKRNHIAGARWCSCRRRSYSHLLGICYCCKGC